jgi:predicted signal transduction protein with EAL and GGDEF domain
MSWLWLNIPLATVFFLATTMIPLWLVIKHPDSRPETAVRAPRAADRTARVLVAAQAHRSVAGQVHRSAA